MDSAPDFGGLIDLHSSELLAYLTRLLDERQAAEDCLQDVYLRAYRAYSRLPAEANRRAWLYRIATNVARTAWGRRGREAARTAPLDDEARDPAATVEDGLERSEQLVRLRAAVDALPHKQRAALILRRYQGLAYEAIGPILGCSPEAARANAYQALKRLRSLMAAAPAEDGGESW